MSGADLNSSSPVSKVSLELENLSSLLFIKHVGPPLEIFSPHVLHQELFDKKKNSDKSEDQNLS